MRPVSSTCALLLAASAELLYPQIPAAASDSSKPTVLVRGTVIDRDSHVPIPGAIVTTAQPVTLSPSEIVQSGPGAMTAGPGGEFQLQAKAGDTLTLSARSAGYQLPALVVQKIAVGDTTVSVEIPLVKLQSLRGVLVDDETRKPISGLGVELIAYSGGLEIGMMPGKMKTTSYADGSFFFNDIQIGEYYLRITDRPSPVVVEIPAKALEGDGRDKALETPQGAVSYGTIVWPGNNADVPTVPGIKIDGAPVDLGEIRLSKTRLRNLSGLAGPCEEGANVQITLSRPASSPAIGMLATNDIKCGGGYQLLNLPDATMAVSAVQGFPQRRWVSQSIDARARGPLRLTLASLVTLQISVEVEEGSVEDLPPGFRIGLERGSRAVQTESPVMLRPGAFEATLYPGERYWISAQAGPKFYLKRLVFNGSTLPELTGFTASTASLSQLTVVLSKHPATLDVHFSEGGTAKSVAQVFLLPDGVSFAEFQRHLNPAGWMRTTDSSGGASFTGLAPGTYRAGRVLPGKPLPTTEPLFRAMLADASQLSSSVTVDEGQAARIDWDVP